MIFQEDFEQTRFLEQDLTFLSAKTEFDESNIPFKEKNLGIQNQDGLYTNLDLLLSDQFDVLSLREMEHRKAFSMVLDLAYSLCITLVFRAFPIHADCTLYTHTTSSRAYA